MLSEKYAPNTLNSIIGNRNAAERIAAFGLEVQSRKVTKPLMLYGPSGTGKTAAVHALAYSHSFELLELNASDYRNVERLKKVLLPASRSRGLFSRTILILLDEIDELSRKFDNGAEGVILDVISKSMQPIIFTANDYWDQKIGFLRNSVEKIEFKRIPDEQVYLLLKTISRNEGGRLADEMLKNIARRCNGDVRAAINDLEAMLGASPELMENLGIRDTKMEIFGVLDKIFGSSNFEIAKNAVMRSNVELGMLMAWLSENIPKRYNASVARYGAYENLSRASRFYEKATRTNYYGYLRYASVLLSSGVSLSGGGAVSRLKQYSFPAHIRQLSATKKERLSVNSIAARLSAIMHCSRKEIANNYLPYLRLMIERSLKHGSKPEILSRIEQHYGLLSDDVETILWYYKSRF